MNAYIYINYRNIVVLRDYLDVVKTALEQNGYTCEYITSMKGINKNSIIVFPMSKDALKYYFSGYRRFVIWQQGATAEESFMRNHSIIRKGLLNLIDIWAMKKAIFILYVSEYMKMYYENMSHGDFSAKSYVMPCFNEQYDDLSVKRTEYNHTFAYVGSLDLWQCFEKTVDIYKEIEKKVPDCKLKVLTFQEDEAERVLKEKNVRNYLVKSVSKDKVRQELMECTYGFVIREDSIVNRVATPTKLSSYLAAGVMPIFSECLRDFAEVAKKYNVGYSVSSEIDVQDIVRFVMKEKNKEEICRSIYNIFDTYYNRDSHVAKICNIMKNIR